MALTKKSISKNFNFIVLLFISFFCWVSIPNFGETTIWIIGSVNYLWTTVIILLFLLPFRLKYFSSDALKNSKLSFIGMFLLGILCGWTNENTALSTILVSLLLLIYFYKNKLLTKWMISGVTGTIIGYLFMFFAPGNFLRSGLLENDSFLLYHVKIPIIVTMKIMFYQSMIWIFLFILIYLLISFCKQNNIKLASLYIEYKKELNFSFVFILISILNNLIMFASPYFPERAGFASTIFLIIGVMSLLRIEIIPVRINKMNKVIPVVMSLYLLVTMAFVVMKYYQLNNEYSARLEYINNNVANENKDIILEKFTMDTPSSIDTFFNHVFIRDVGEDANQWPNTIFARYYNLDSVVINKEYKD